MKTACPFPDGVLHDHGAHQCHEASYEAGRALGRREALTSDGSVTMTCERYSLSTGSAGSVIDAGVGYPVIYANDRGYVEIDEYRIPAADFISWARSVANAVEAREDAR